MQLEAWLLAIPPIAVYLTVGLVIGVESLGTPMPGEIVLVSSALLAVEHHALNPVWIAVCASTGAIVGDSIGYLIGRTHGRRLAALARRRFPKHFAPERIRRARRLVSRHGAWAVFFGRFVALLRILAGPLAGSLRMPYGKFLVANVLGGITWAAGTTAAVYFLGAAAEKWLSRASWVALVVAAAAALTVVLVLRMRHARLARPDGDLGRPADA